MTIGENLHIVLNNIQNSCLKAGRDKDEIGLIAVTKTVSAEKVDQAYSHGIRLIGENRVQEAKEKAMLVTSPIEWHLIGHLQSNKAKNAVELFSLIHTIDDLELAAKVDLHAQKNNKIQKVLMQVNYSGESSKNGMNPSMAARFLEEVTRFENLMVSGIMTIAPIAKNPEDIRWVFKDAKTQFEVLKKLNLSNVCLQHLSMGMSFDYKIAIEEGSTMVRIGRALFGERINMPH